MIAACGLVCRDCDIRKLPFDPQSAEICVTWYRSMGWLGEDQGAAEAIERGMYCQGCLGSREIHWSANCWILHCAVDEKGLQNCSQCAEFPCGRLQEWSTQNERYTAALENLIHLG